MHLTLQMALVAAVVCAAWCEPAAAPGSRIARAKQPRATRGFKNTEMMTARGFGKRNYHAPREMFGLDNFWDMLDASQERGQQEQADDKTVDSIPIDWFVDEMLNNPEFTRTVVRKFVDINQDGTLSPDELLRNAY